ncbi:hypothetical protein RKD37_000247 [Streptomyces ambofaciens]
MPGSASWSAATSTAAAKPAWPTTTRSSPDGSETQSSSSCPTPALGDWNDVLLRACHGQGEQDRDWVQQQIPPEPTHRRHRRREEPRVYVWEYLTRTSHHNGGMRSISATFRMTQPTDAQAMEWMIATMRHALRWGSSRPALA